MNWLALAVCLLWVGVARADTATFSIASGTDVADCESTSPSAGWPPAFNDCYDSDVIFVSKDNFPSTSNYYVSVGLMRWNTSTLVGSTIASATVDFCIQNVGNGDSRDLQCEWYPNWVTPSSADYTTGSSGTALSVALASLDTSGSPCTVNTLVLTAPDANIQKTGTTALRCTISGSTPTDFNEIPLTAGNDLTMAPKLNVVFTPPETPTPGGPPTSTPTVTPSATWTKTQTPTATSCLPTIHAPLVETNVVLPNGVITVPAPGIPMGRSAILSLAYYLSVPDGHIGLWSGHITDSAGNTWACDGGTTSAFTIQSGTGCPANQIGLHISQPIGGGMCTLGLCHNPIPPGGTITIPGQADGPTTAAVSLVDIENINISAGSFRDFGDSVIFDCQCYPPDGRGPTIGGVWSTVNEGAINCNPAIQLPQTHSGTHTYYGEMSDGLNGAGGYSIPAGYLIWSSIASETTFTPVAGATVFKTLTAPNVVLTTMYKIQPSTGTWSLGGDSAPQLWTEGGGGFLPICEAEFVAQSCPATPTSTPTVTGTPPTPTITPTATVTRTSTATLPPATSTEIAQQTATAGPPATQTQSFHDTQTAAPTGTPTGTATGTPPTATRTPSATTTPTPNPQFGCCVCPLMCSVAVTESTCILAGCHFGGVGTVCALVP